MNSTGSNSANAKGGPAVLTDFDDTAAVENVAELLLNRFADPSWQDVRRRFRDGEFTLKEYQEIAFNSIHASRSDMAEYVRDNAHLRPYFGELWDYCREWDVPMVVVSAGLDFYVEALIEGNGLTQVPVYAVDTDFTPAGISYEYRFVRPGMERMGNSKGLIVDQFREQGHYIIYIGDGMSDFEAAERADLVFAHRSLAEECARTGIPFRHFEDFRDVLAAVQDYVNIGTGTTEGRA